MNQRMPAGNLPDITTTVQKFIAAQYPGALCAFIAGSHTRGQETPASDIDLVVMFDEDYATPHRNSYIYDGWPIEVFVQNVKAQEYFFEQDRLRGMCVLATMISEGDALGPDMDLATARKLRARAFIEAGPATLTAEDVKRRVYTVCDALDDIRHPRPEGELLGCLSELYLRLGDLYLRAQNQWSGTSKQLYRRLALHNEDLAAQYEKAFAKAFDGHRGPLLELADMMLEPLGGFTWAGYYAAANEKWRE